MLLKNLDRKIIFESYGVTVTIEGNDADVLAKATEIANTALLGQLEFIENAPKNGPRLGVGVDSIGTLYLFQDGVELARTESETRFFKFFNGVVRLAVAGNSVDRVFVHAGVIGWKGRAVVIPGTSHSGKTTLVAEFLKLGAVYFSDEYAILDLDGKVHPFARPLLMRGQNGVYSENIVAVETISDKIAVEPWEIGAVLITEFQSEAEWKPEALSIGGGILETIPHAIPISSDAKLAMRVLSKAYERAIIVKSPRGDAAAAARIMADFLDGHLN
ncbi:MAG: hypothetical protein ACRD6X_08075 [Pyrinomonadaceae bacterium]